MWWRSPPRRINTSVVNEDARRDLAESRRREALFQNPTDPHRVGLDIDGVRVEGDPKSMEEVQRWRREASFYCDKAEDRLYHAVDKTWWRREQGGPMKGHLVQGSEPPACFYELARALVLNFGGLLHETSYAEASDREGPENAVLRRIVDDVTRLGMTLPEMKFAYEADNAVVLDSFPETLTTKSLDEIMAG